MTLAEIRTLYDSFDKKCGCDTSHIELKSSSRMINTLGCCEDDGLIPLSITIASFVLPLDICREVALHEYAHAVVKLRYPNEVHGHDKVWQDVCKEVGISPNRLCEDHSVAEIINEVKSKKAKYLIICPHCGNKNYFMRKTKVVTYAKEGNLLGCNYCHKTLPHWKVIDL